MICLLAKVCRGRTGTFAALVVARLRRVASLSELVDVVVGLREARDGLLELPHQFRYAAALTGVDGSPCGLSCLLRLAGSGLTGSRAPQGLLLAVAFLCGVFAAALASWLSGARRKTLVAPERSKRVCLRG